MNMIYGYAHVSGFIGRFARVGFLFLFILPLITGCFKSNDQDIPDLKVVGLYLPDGETTLYEYHRFNYVIGVRASGNSAAHLTVTANVFLVDSQMKDGDPISDGENACHVGSVEITFDDPGEDVFVSDLGVPLSGCSLITDESAPMSFAVYLDTNDRLLGSEALYYDYHFILTDAMRADEKNQQCIGPDGQPGCVQNVLVQASPGIDLEIENLVLDSNIVLNYERSTVAMNYDELHTPNSIVTVELWVDGVPPEDDNALEIGEYAELKFDIRPAKGSDEWVPLTVMNETVLAPVGHDANAVINEIRSGGESHYTHALFFEADAYEATGPGGYWQGKTNYELRACVLASVSEADIPVEDESANNCMVVPFFLTERLDFDPDLYEEDATPVVIDDIDNDGNVEAVTQAGLTKKYSLSRGDENPTRVSLSLENQAVFGIEGVYDGLGVMLVGRGIPFAKIDTILEANQSGWLDLELMHISFSHKLTHKDDNTVDWARKYHPGAQLRLLGYRLLDLEGTVDLPDGDTTIIDNDRLEALGGLFVKDKDKDAKEGDEISYAQELCQKNGINAQVLEITANICAVGVAGIDYGISIFSAAPPFIAPFDMAHSVVGLDVSIDPFVELDLVASAKVDLAIIKAEIAATVALIKLHMTHQLPSGEFKDGAGFSLTSGAELESKIISEIGTESLLEERVLDGKIDLKAIVPTGIYFTGFFEPHVKTKTVRTKIFSWEGISISKQKLWKLDRTDDVVADSI